MEIAGKRIVVTGILPGLTREDAEARIAYVGGYVEDKVTTSTAYVVVGTRPGKVKLEAAKRFGVPTIDAEQFLTALYLCGGEKRAEQNKRAELQARADRAQRDQRGQPNVPRAITLSVTPGASEELLRLTDSRAIAARKTVGPRTGVTPPRQEAATVVLNDLRDRQVAVIWPYKGCDMAFLRAEIVRAGAKLLGTVTPLTFCAFSDSPDGGNEGVKECRRLGIPLLGADLARPLFPAAWIPAREREAWLAARAREEAAAARDRALRHERRGRVL